MKDNPLVKVLNAAARLKAFGASNDSLASEELCFGLVAELRKRWNGVLWHNPDPTPEEQRIVEELTGKRFLYRRVGYDERLTRITAIIRY
ncbi:MAG: hypothetical protein KatS3mg105_0586 [Gemmatales bacterium]|nr:MAG: hypothetical protein KatS3mg105_0586 [Gemmatales bacterium]